MVTHKNHIHVMGLMEMKDEKIQQKSALSIFLHFISWFIFSSTPQDLDPNVTH